MSPQDILSILEREKVISLSDGRSRKVSASEFAFFFSLEYDDKTNIWLADINLDFEKEPEANPVSPFTENTPVTASTGKPAGFWMLRMKPGMKNQNMTKWEQIENLTQVSGIMYGLSYHFTVSDMPQHNQNDKRQYQEQYSPDTAALFI